MNILYLLLWTTILSLLVIGGATAWYAWRRTDARRTDARRTDALAAPSPSPGPLPRDAESTEPADEPAPLAHTSTSLPLYRSVREILRERPSTLADDPVRPAQRGHPLTLEGIDEATLRTLHRLGYTSLEQIAACDRDDIHRIAQYLGVDRSRVEREWVGRARHLLAESRPDLVEGLNGGHRG